MSVPATHGQRRIWAAHHSSRLANSELVPLVYRIEGDLDVARLERAFAATIARHDALRTSLIARAGEILQVPLTDWTFQLVVTDLAAAAEGPEPWARHVARFVADGFALDTGLLLKAALFRLGPRTHVLVMAAHHSAMDGVSIGILQEDISLAYARDAAPRQSGPTSFADYSRWTAARETAGDFEEGVGWQLARLPAIDDVPLLHPEQPRGVTACRPSFVRYAIAADVHAAVVAQARQHWAFGPAQLYLAALFLFLAAYTRRPYVVVGCVVPNRLRAEDRDTVGFFVNIVPMAMDVSWRERGLDYLKAAHRVIFDALKRQHVPYGLLLREWSGDPYRFDRTPFHALFTFRPQQRPPLALADCHVTGVEPPWWPLPFELMVDFDEEPDSCTGLVRWDDAVCGPTIARGLRLVFSDILRQLCMEPEAPLAILRDRITSVLARAAAAGDGAGHPADPIEAIRRVSPAVETSH